LLLRVPSCGLLNLSHTRINELLVPSIPKFVLEAAAKSTNFGIETLAPECDNIRTFARAIAANDNGRR
jgi:hypothetical protein